MECLRLGLLTRTILRRAMHSNLSHQNSMYRIKFFLSLVQISKHFFRATGDFPEKSARPSPLLRVRSKKAKRFLQRRVEPEKILQKPLRMKGRKLTLLRIRQLPKLLPLFCVMELKAMLPIFTLKGYKIK